MRDLLKIDVLGMTCGVQSGESVAIDRANIVRKVAGHQNNCASPSRTRSTLSVPMACGNKVTSETRAVFASGEPMSRARSMAERISRARSATSTSPTLGLATVSISAAVSPKSPEIG